jgi:DNA-binding FadR family transcriptional regulator
MFYRQALAQRKGLVAVRGAGVTGEVGLTTVAARAILAPVGEPSGRADTIARRLGEAIRLGLLLDREQLPPEAEFAGQLGVSTVTLREALATLREQGLVITRRGRGGGTFVRAPADPNGGLVARLRQFTTGQLRDLGDHRCAVSGTAALLAAQRASPGELDGLTRQVERLAAARTASARRRAHTQFCVDVAAAAQSPRLAREEIRLAAEVGDLLWLWIGDAGHVATVQARAALVGAIRAAEGERARELAEQQVRADTQRLCQSRIAVYALDRGVSGPVTAGTAGGAP